MAARRSEADPTNGDARVRLADAGTALGRSYASLASTAKDKSDAARHWREARAWYQKSVDLLAPMHANDSLPATAKGELELIAGLIAKSDLGLAALSGVGVK